MIGYQSTLLGRTEVAEGTMAFQFEKPNDFVFKAGQYIDLTLSDSQPGPSNGLTHTFSIASSPFDEELLVTTRIRNTVFKQAISSLPIGSPVRIEGPMGSLSLHNNTARQAVFLAGGIGIAPFLRMLTYATAQGKKDVSRSKFSSVFCFHTFRRWTSRFIWLARRNSSPLCRGFLFRCHGGTRRIPGRAAYRREYERVEWSSLS